MFAPTSASPSQRARSGQTNCRCRPDLSPPKCTTSTATAQTNRPAPRHKPTNAPNSCSIQIPPGWEDRDVSSAPIPGFRESSGDLFTVVQALATSSTFGWASLPSAVFVRVPNATTESSPLRDRNDLDRGRDRNACRQTVQQEPYRAGATRPSPSCVVDVFHTAIVANRRSTEQTEEAPSRPRIHPNRSLGSSVTQSPKVTPSPSAFIRWRCIGPARSTSRLRFLLNGLARERRFRFGSLRERGVCVQSSAVTVTAIGR
jgi:hypothetical protein